MRLLAKTTDSQMKYFMQLFQVEAHFVAQFHVFEMVPTSFVPWVQVGCVSRQGFHPTRCLWCSPGIPGPPPVGGWANHPKRPTTAPPPPFCLSFPSTSKEKPAMSIYLRAAVRRFCAWQSGTTCCLILMGVFGGQPVSASDAAKLDEIRDAALNQAKLIRSIECDISSVMQIHTDDPTAGGHLREPLPSNTEQKVFVHYIQSGDWYRIESEMSDAATGVKDTEIVAYNGDRYQLFDKGRKKLGYKKTPVSSNPSRMLNPLICPYCVWLFGEDADQVYSEVKNAKYWDDRFAVARYRGLRDENGTAVEVVEFPYPSNNRLPDNMRDAVVQVHFALDLAYYPIACITKTGKGNVLGESRVTEYKEFEIDGQKVVIPLAQTVSWSVPGEVQVSSICTIPPETIQINSPIDEDVFTIPHTWATVVEDVDKNEEVHKKLLLEEAERAAQAQAWNERNRLENVDHRRGSSTVVWRLCCVAVSLGIAVLIVRAWKTRHS